MTSPRKPYPTFREYARAMEREATLGEGRADVLGRAAAKAEQDGDAGRAEVMRQTCRKIRVQALLDRGRAGAAEVRVRDDE